jgi:hypothetical protein
MKHFLLSIILTSSLLGFSQSEYPMLLKIDTETVCAFSLDQVDSLNVMFVNLDECLAVKDSLKKEIWQHETREARFASFINEQDKKIYLQMKITNELMKQNDTYSSLNEINKKKIKFLKFQRDGLLVAVAIAAVKIFVIH